MAYLETYTQQPSDLLDYDVQYDDFLTEGDALASVAVVVAPLGLVVDAVRVGKSVKLWVSEGTDRTTYKITIKVTTTDGRIKEDELKFKIKDY